MNFSTEISLGTIISGLVLLVTLFALHTQNVGRLSKMETRVDALWRVFMRDQRRRGHDDDPIDDGS